VLKLWIEALADQAGFLLSRTIEPLNLAIPLPQLDVVTVDELLGSLDGLAFVLAKQIDRTLHPAVGP
jgi:hypothetical protein